VILTLTRWDPALPPVPYNLVLLMQNEAQKLHDHGKSAFSAEVVQRIEERLRWAKKACEESWETFDHTGGSQACTVVTKKGPVRGAAGTGVVSVRASISTGNVPYLTFCGAVVAFMVGYGASRLANK